MTLSLEIGGAAADFGFLIMWSLLYPASPYIPVSENVVVNARGRSPRDTHTA